MEQIAHFYCKECQNPDVAISPSGRFIALKCSGSIAWEAPPNVFVYRNDGTLVDSFYNSASNEIGIEFWSDEHHLIIPGCRGKALEYDGIKLWEIGSHRVSPIFQSTPLTGIMIDLYGVSPRYRYIAAAHHQETFLFDSSGGYLIELPGGVLRRSCFFSDDEQFFAVNTAVNTIGASQGGMLFESESGKLIWSDSWGNILYFSYEDGNQFVTYNMYQNELEFRSLEFSQSENTPIKTVGLQRAKNEYIIPHVATLSRNKTLLAIGHVVDSKGWFVGIFDPNSGERIGRVPLIGAYGGWNYVSDIKFSFTNELIIVEKISEPQSGYSEKHIQTWRL